MLTELEVRDFAIIDHIRCAFQPGLNIVTGETGAGKSIIVDALGQLLGARADTTVVRAGCERALVQGAFDPGETRAAVDAVLEAHGLEHEPDLILTREILAAGRSTARVNGRVVPVRVLSEVGQALVDIHGQSESASLKREARHLDLLDAHAGLIGLRRVVSEHVTQLRRIDAQVAAIRRDEAERYQRAARLAFVVDEIGAARLSPVEEDDLLAERRRLANAETLARLADEAYAALRDETGDGVAGLDLLDRAHAALTRLTEVDPTQQPVADALLVARESAADQASLLRAYRDGMAFDPGRLDEVEERLAAISDLKRKYGGNISAVLDHAAQAADELARIQGSEQELAELTERADALRRATGARCGELSSRRTDAAAALSREVEAHMNELRMPDSRFEVSISQVEDGHGVPVDDRRLSYDETGVDRVAFLVSTNPGEPVRPLVKVASGGETARLMLALKTVLAAADPVPTLVFDEIDAGIGGRVGAIVGRKLWTVGRAHQVLCVTHLPQVAVYGDVHLQASKAVADGRTTTRLQRVEGEARVAEVTQMLGSAGSAGARNAAQLMDESDRWKASGGEVDDPPQGRAEDGADG